MPAKKQQVKKQQVKTVEAEEETKPTIKKISQCKMIIKVPMPIKVNDPIMGEVDALNWAPTPCGKDADGVNGYCKNHSLHAGRCGRHQTFGPGDAAIPR